MTHVRKIKSGGVNTSWQNFVGEVGILFYDQTLGNLRLSDGHTPGGVALTIDSTQAVATTSTVGSVKPDGTTIRVDQYGVISAVSPGGTGDIAFVHGTMYHTSSTAITLQPSLFSDGYVFGTDGNLIFPGGAYIGGNGGYPGEIDIIAGSSQAAASLGSNDLKNYFYVDNDGSYIYTNLTNEWLFGLDGTITFPNQSLSTKNDLSIVAPNVTVQSANLTIRAGQGIPSEIGNLETWTTDWNENPRINLPTTVAYGIGTGLRVTVLESGGVPYDVTIVTPGSGYENNQVVQVISGNSVLVVRIIVPSTKNWIFGTDGTTQFPYYTFPASTGTVGQVLISNGLGTLAWTTPITTVSNLISGTYTVSLSATGDLLPTANNLGNLGSPTQQWNALYVNTATVYIGGNALRVSSEAGITLNNQGIGVNTISAGTDTAVVGSAGTFTINSISTLQSITGRGATTNNRISITNTTTSAGYQTGALTVSGGVGIAGALNVNGTATFGSTAVFQGPVTFAASSNTSYTANLFMLHTPPDGATTTWTINDGKDIGILYPYYTGATGTTGALVLSNGSKNLEWFGSNYSTSTQLGSYGTFKTNAIVLVGGTQSTDINTGDLIISGGVGIGKNLRAAYIYSNGWVVTTTTFNTSTLVAISVTSTFAQSFNTATLVALAVTSTYAQSFNTATLVALAVTSTYAQSFNTATLVNTAVNAGQATNSLYASTATYAQSFNTATLVNTAVNATTSSYANTASYARSFNTSTLVAIAVTSTFAQSFNTATLVSNAVIASGLGSNIITISNTSTAISNTSGALQVSGGVGVAGNIYANAVYSNGYAVSTSTASAITIQLNGTTLGVPTTINFSTGTTASIVGNVVTVQATAISGSATTSTLNAGTYTVALSTSGVLTIPGTLQNLLNIGSVTISASSGTNTATWTFGTAGSLAFPDGSKQLTAFTGTVVFNTGTLVALAVSANTATIAQSVVGGIGVATLTAGTGTFISTSTGAVTIWVTTASTGTLVALAVTSTYAQSFNTATLVALAVSANTATIAQSVVGGIGVATLTAGTGTYISTSTGAVTIWVTTASTGTLVALAVTSTFAQSFNTATLVSNAVYANTASGNFTVPGNLNVNGGTIYNNGYALTTATAFNTATLVAIAVSATTSSFATTSGYAQSFNTGTLVALAITSTYAQSFNTATLVASAVSATTSSYATTASFAQSFNTATLVASAVSANTATIAQSVVGGIGVATLVGSSGTVASTSTGSVTIWFNTATLVAQAVSATTSSYATTASGLGGNVIVVANTTNSTSTTTGALQVIGGVGVGGNLYVGGIVTATTFIGLAGTGTTATTAASIGYMGTPINTQASTYTLVIGDAGKTIYAGGNLTIPANSSVAFPVGTIVNVIASSAITVAITTDTLQWGGQATSQTGTRTVAAYGMASLIKVTSTIWYISGAGVT